MLTSTCDKLHLNKIQGIRAAHQGVSSDHSAVLPPAKLATIMALNKDRSRDPAPGKAAQMFPTGPMKL